MQKIVTISGTNRPGNYTSRALGVVNRRLRERSVELETFDGRDLDLAFPGQPDTDDDRDLRSAVEDAEGVILASPEYHGTFSAMTKLVVESLGFPSALENKPVGLLGVAAGRIGAIKTLEHMRGMCGHVGAIVLPRPVSIAGVQKVFDEEGNCTDSEIESLLEQLADEVADFVFDVVCPKHYLESMTRDDEPLPWGTSV